MANTDGQDLARDFYNEVFSDTTQGERYYERTAKALRDAVVKLRRKRNTTLEALGELCSLWCMIRARRFVIKFVLERRRRD